MCRYGETSLAPDTTAAGAARRWLRRQLGHWELDDMIDDLQLVLSELVTNAVLHARSAVDVVLSVGEGTIELAVADTDARVPTPLLAERMSEEGGRGLALVNAISDEWGVTHRGAGKQIWVRLAAPDDWSFRLGCVCGDDGEAPHTASGHRVVDMLDQADSR